ncbi:MAG: hypothetical protein ACUVSX_16920 [Aggregatilineales bacterium]
MNDDLQQGEYRLGRYRVRFARFTSLGWDTQGPWMRAVVTNRRLVFTPEDAASPIAPLELTPSSIARIWNVCLGRRDGLIIALKTGQMLYLFIDWSQGAHLGRDLRELLTPPLQPRIAPRAPHKQLVN